MLLSVPKGSQMLVLPLTCLPCCQVRFRNLDILTEARAASPHGAGHLPWVWREEELPEASSLLGGSGHGPGLGIRSG